DATAPQLARRDFAVGRKYVIGRDLGRLLRTALEDAAQAHRKRERLGRHEEIEPIPGARLIPGRVQHDGLHGEREAGAEDERARNVLQERLLGVFRDELLASAVDELEAPLLRAPGEPALVD